MDTGIMAAALQIIEEASNTLLGNFAPSVDELFDLAAVTLWGISIVVVLLTGRFPGPALISAVVKIAVIGWLVKVFPTASGDVVKAMGNVGNLGLSTGSFDLSQPDSIILFGFTAVTPVIDATKKLLGPVSFFLNFIQIQFYVFAIVATVLAFVAAAIHVFFTWIEFFILRTAAYFVIPFALVSKTAFIATKGIGYVASVGLKLLVLTATIACAAVAMQRFTQYASVMDSIPAALLMGALAVGLFIAITKVPATAAALINSGPVLDGAMAWGAFRSTISSSLQTMNNMDRASNNGAGLGAGGGLGGMAASMSSGAGAAWSAVRTAFGGGNSGSGGASSGSQPSGSQQQSGSGSTRYPGGSYGGQWGTNGQQGSGQGSTNTSTPQSSQGSSGTQSSGSNQASGNP